MERKEQLLNETYKRLCDTGFGNLNDLDMLIGIMSDNMIAIGTAQDEIYYSTEEVKAMCQRQREQTEGMNLRYRREELFRFYQPADNIAIIADIIILLLEINKEPIEMRVRFTTVFHYQKDKWKIVHFHGSKPENVNSDTDTFGINEWKERAAALEHLVAERTRELRLSNEELNDTIKTLKSTQQQLIQSEKMASLGELTAGIAHEIQNPLNFVNNFSEVNKELAEELEEEAIKGNLEEVKNIAKDIKENEQKINHHGKRADAIVKSMLSHSRTSSGSKELTDINALCDEYLRLAYHGFRAKDKSFNAKFETDFDISIGNLNVVSQDIGRVILNLINNAFYAVNEKAKKEVTDYQPTVIVSTKNLNGKVEIRVKDNGNGIPESIKEKIFQPFFTTKPTGSGTGLGLSLSYDIVRAHGGEIKVETKEGTGAEFKIILP